MSKITLEQLHVLIETKDGTQIEFDVDTVIQTENELKLFFGTYTRYPGAVKVISTDKIKSVVILPHVQANFDTEKYIAPEEDFEKWLRKTQTP